MKENEGGITEENSIYSAEMMVMRRLLAAIERESNG